MAFIGIERDIERHWIYQDAEYFKVWFEILIRARFSNEPEKKMMEGKFVVIEYGQFIYGRISWSERLKVSEQRLRTLFKKLIDDEMIEVIQAYPKFTLYSVKNYAKYNQQSNHQQDHAGQGDSDYSNQQINDTSTSSQPAPNQQPTTQEQGSNKVNKDNKVIKYSAEFEKFWSHYPKQSGKPAAFNNFKKLLKKHDAEYLITCSMNYGSYCAANGIENQYMKMPNNFLNAKDEYYRQFDTAFVIHNRSSSRYQRTTSKLDQMLAEAEGRTNGTGGYHQTGTDHFS